MSPSYQEEEQLSYQRLADALIEATPEWWTEATLELVPTWHGSVVGLQHSITNRAGHRDIVEPTPNLYAATQELHMLAERRGDKWTRCTFNVFQENGTWRYVAEYAR